MEIEKLMKYISLLEIDLRVRTDALIHSRYADFVLACVCGRGCMFACACVSEKERGRERRRRETEK